MKKIIITLSILLTVICSYGQSILKLNNLVDIKLPIGALPINHDKAILLTTELFHNDIGAKITLEDGYPYVYQIGNIVFNLHTINRPLKPGLLQSVLVGRGKVLTERSGYTHYITKIYGKDILLTKYSGAVSIYSFNCINTANTIGLNGTFVFNKADEVQAKLILEAILATIKFSGE